MIFKGQSIIEFSDRFKSDMDCLEYMAEIKWANGYKCPKCGHDRFSVVKRNLARECNRCHHRDSPTANTIFHKLKFGMRKAFMIVFEMTASTKGLSSSQVAKRYEISRTTAWYFMHKVRTAMKSSKKHPLEGDVQVDEFVYGGKEALKQGRSNDSRKKKIVGSVELTEKGKVRRTYFKKIDNYSSGSLRLIFDEHIAPTATVFTDKWTGYTPIKADYNIISKYSAKGNSMKQIHTIIHQLKSWLRSVYSWIDEKHIEKYLDEFSFRINRSIYKDTIFHKLMERIIQHHSITYQMIKVSS